MPSGKMNDDFTGYDITCNEGVHRYYVTKDTPYYQIETCFNCSIQRRVEKPWDGKERKRKDETTKYKRRRSDAREAEAKCLI